MEHLEQLIGEASIRNINPSMYKDPDDKWVVSPFLRGGGFVEWFLKQMNFRNLKKKMIKTISRAALIAFWNAKMPLLIHYDKDFLQIQREVSGLLRQDLKNNPERDIIVRQCIDMMNQGLLYFQSENKFYQTLTSQGRMVLRPIAQNAHAFGVAGLKVPKPVEKVVKGQTVIKWVYEDFYKIYQESEQQLQNRYQFFEWSPEALDPNYDLLKLGDNFNAFSGFMRDGSYFQQCWKEADEDIKEKVDTIRHWVRRGICGGQIPYKQGTQQYLDITGSYLHFLEKIIKNMIMYPWNRSGVFVVMHGDQGTGKGVLVNTLANRIYGPGSPLFRTVTKAEHIFGHYSLDGEDQALMVLLDETKIDTEEHVNSLKNAVTEGVRNANCKFKAQAPVQCWWQGFLATNSPTPVLIQGNERRIFVVCTKLIKEGDVFPRFVSELIQNPKYFDAWLGYICSSYPEVTDKWHAQSDRPQTYAYHNLKVRSFSPVSAWWLECMRRGWFSEEPTTEDGLCYRSHQTRPLWKNTRNPRTLWNDYVSHKWLFSCYFKEAKEFVSVRTHSKGRQDDPSTKFQSEIIPLIYGPKFNLTKVPKDDQGLMQIPDLKTCVINFCKFHYIYDVSMLHIPSMPRLVLKHKPEEEMNNGEDVWKVMRRILVDPLLSSKKKEQKKEEIPEQEDTYQEDDSTYDLSNYEVEDDEDGEGPTDEEEEEEEEDPRPTKKRRKWQEEKPVVDDDVRFFDDDEEENPYIDPLDGDDEELSKALEDLHQIHKNMGTEEEEEEVMPPHQPETEEEFNNRYAKKMLAQGSLIPSNVQEEEEEEEEYKEDKNREKDDESDNNPFVFNL